MDALISKGFWLAGIVNIAGILLFSQGFSNDVLVKHDPGLFNDFGVLMIMLWGLAYIGAAPGWRQLRLLVFVFALEKLAYGLAWICWLSANQGQLGDIYAESFLTGLFYSTYGVVDLSFCAFFLLAWVVAGRPQPR